MVKKMLKFTYQILILIIIYQLGNQIAHFFHLRIPGNVVGIVILFGLLWMGLIKVEQIEMAAGWLLKHLGFFFIPISVSLMTLGDVLVNKGLVILIVLIISAVVGIVAAGKATQSIITKKEKAEVNYHDHAL